MFEIAAVTYGHGEKLKCFINSIKAQSSDKWNLHIVHDGKGEDFYKLKEELESNGYLNDKIVLSASEERYNDYGHSLRSHCLKNPICESAYTILTNGDNYYPPVWIETLSHWIEKCAKEKVSPDIIFWDLISHHSYMNCNFDRNHPYGVLSTQFQEASIDMGSVAIKTKIAQKVGFNSRGFAADWHYFSECYKSLEKPIVLKIPQVLLVHN